jgi:hypothetical protein
VGQSPFADAIDADLAYLPALLFFEAIASGSSGCIGLL